MIKLSWMSMYINCINVCNIIQKYSKFFVAILMLN